DLEFRVLIYLANALSIAALPCKPLEFLRQEGAPIAQLQA
ncbi:MAG: hypothetical protein RL341_2555, partial [Pseudomonadota bacterium]